MEKMVKNLCCRVSVGVYLSKMKKGVVATERFQETITFGGLLFTK